MQGTQEIFARPFFCNCSKHCGNPAKEVSQATYYRHSRARQADQSSPAFREFLRTELPDHSNKGRKRLPTTTTPALPGNKRPCKGKGRDYEAEAAATGQDDRSFVRLYFLQVFHYLLKAL